MAKDIQLLKRRLEALQRCAGQRHAARGLCAFGVDDLDHVLHGGLSLGKLHETHAATPSDAATLAAFGAAIARRIGAGRAPVVWVRQRRAETETGALHGRGLAPSGLDPCTLILVRARTMENALSAGLEAVRCAALSAVIIETWGASPALSLSATRRLALAAEDSGVTPVLLRIAADQQPSAAFTRWQVAAAPSRPRAANAPGRPVFDLGLLRNRAGACGQRWRVEWNHETCQFRSVPSLSCPVVPVPARRQAETSSGLRARAG